MRVLVTGATGLLGRAIVAALKEADFEVIAAAFSRARDGMIAVDLRSEEAIKAAITTHRPGIVVHAAAERRPDVCEGDETHSETLNIDAVWHLARACSAIGSEFIHISTDYIFDGTAPPYKEDAPAHPLNAYGRQKLRGEHAALAGHARPFILRVPVLFGPSPDVAESAVTVFANTVAEASKPRTLDAWQVRVPTYTPDIAQTLANVCKAMQRNAAAVAAAPAAADAPAAAAAAAVAHAEQEKLGGIFHYSSDDCLTRYSIATAIAEVLGVPHAHITSDAAPPPGAPRPKDAKLDCSKLKALGLAHECTPFKAAMAEVLAPFKDALVAKATGGAAGAAATA